MYKKILETLICAVHKDEIPKKYKTTFLGKGATSLVYEFDDDHVLIFTRDNIKAEYLVHNNLAEYLDEIDIRNYKNKFSKLPIIVLKAIKLYKLSPENKKLVNKIVKQFNEINSEMKSKNRRLSTDRVNQMIINAFKEKYEDHFLTDFLDFISNYNNYHFDLGVRNLMQDKNGKIILNDPIVSKELMDIFINK